MALRYHRLIGAALFLALCSGSTSSFSEPIEYNQQHGFDDGTTMQWSGNRFGTVQHMASGGPTGATDRFLLTTVPSFHLGARNTNDWRGDYLAAGVSAIEMDLNHLPPINESLQIRIVLHGPGGMFASSNRTSIIQTNTWTHHVFGLSSNDLVYVTGGTANVNDTMTNVTSLLIRHDRDPPTPQGSHPPHVTATLGIDNVHAVPRKPVIYGMAISNGQFMLNIGDLIVGTSNAVQTTTHLASGAWTNAEGFMVSGGSTNIVVTNASDGAFFRTEFP